MLQATTWDRYGICALKEDRPIDRCAYTTESNTNGRYLDNGNSTDKTYTNASDKNDLRYSTNIWNVQSSSGNTSSGAKHQSLKYQPKYLA